MLYIYESHMGGLYSTNHEQDWDEMYCEQCGDTDQLVGSCADRDIEGVWNLIKPGNLCCSGCAHENTCLADCNKVEDTSLGYDLMYTQKFLHETFPKARWNTVYLIVRDKEGKMYVNCSPAGYKFADAYEIPFAFCHQKELIGKMAKMLMPYVDEDTEDSRLTLLKKSKTKGGYEYVYEYVLKQKVKESEGAYFIGSGWYGWISQQDFKATREQEHLRHLIVKS